MPGNAAIHPVAEYLVYLILYYLFFKCDQCAILRKQQVQVVFFGFRDVLKQV